MTNLKKMLNFMFCLFWLMRKYEENLRKRMGTSVHLLYFLLIYGRLEKHLIGFFSVFALVTKKPLLGPSSKGSRRHFFKRKIGGVGLFIFWLIRKLEEKI